MEEDEDKRWGHTVRERRLALGLTQAQLAAEVGRSQFWVSWLERQRRTPGPQVPIRRHIEAYLRREEAAAKRGARGTVSAEAAAAARYGATVRARRLALGLTLDQLGEAIGRTPGWVGQLELLRVKANAATRGNIEAYLRGAATRANLGGANGAQVTAARRRLRAREVAP